MAMYMTSDKLIESVKRRSAVPVSQITFTNEDFLAFADEEMAMGLVPAILRQHEDYLGYTESIALEADKKRYAIPYRAIGNKLSEVSYRDSNGNVYEMTRIEKDALPYYNGYSTSTNVYAFYVENNEVVLVPDSIVPSANATLDMSFYMRPNSLVMLEKVSVITNIDRTTGQISVTNIPSEYSVTKMFDMYQFRSPHKTLDYDLTATAVDPTTNTITFALADIPSNLVVGDHVSLAEQAAIPQVPADLHVVLAHRVAARCLESMGDLEGLQAANTKLAELEKQTETVIDDRVEGAPRKIVNRHSSLRTGLYARNYRFRR